MTRNGTNQGGWLNCGWRCAAPLIAMALVMPSIGCRLVDPAKLEGKSPLKPLDVPPHHVELDIVFVRVPATADATYEALWTEIDEQAITAEQRRPLLRNGFRVGVIGSELPPSIAKILRNSQSTDGSGAAVDEVGDSGQVGATRRRIFLSPSQRGEIIASSVLPAFHFLEVDDGDLRGTTYADGQAQFAVRGRRIADGRVTLKLTPEVHYGGSRQRYVPGEGMFRIEAGRDRRICDKLSVEATLAAGHVMVLGCDPDRPGSLGHQFFDASTSGRGACKLLLIRVAGQGLDAIYATAPASAQDETVGEE